MTNVYDVFNGDADGICSLHQFRLGNPVEKSTKITGVKRDINLLSRLEKVTEADVIVFDISFDINRINVDQLLNNKNKIIYFDHHFAGEIPAHDNLTCHIDTSPQLCTSLIVNQVLDNRFCKWAICGAFGDNLHKQATHLATKLSLDATTIEHLREIGELLNYNGYGATIEDLHFTPIELYNAVSTYDDPEIFYSESTVLRTLQVGFASDMEKAMEQPPLKTIGENRIFSLPDEPWARRVSGVFANKKARENKAGAHALVTQNSDSTYRISVRAPLDAPRHAETLCKSFPTGGGRAGAAGINNLPAGILDDFFQSFEKTYSN